MSAIATPQAPTRPAPARRAAPGVPGRTAPGRTGPRPHAERAAPSVAARAASTTADAAAPRTNEDLLVAAAGGDERAFEALYERLAPQVLGVAQRVLRDRAMAEEVAQEVFVEVWRKAGHFDPGRGSAAGWVTTFAHRRAIDRVRSEQAARDRDVVATRRNAQPALDDVQEEVAVRLDHGQVRAALASLSPRQREAIELAYFAGHTYRDVARVLGIPEGTAKSRLRDGLLRLQGALTGLV